MEFSDEISKQVSRLSSEDKQQIEDDVVAVIAFFEGLARYFELSLPENGDEVARLAGYLRECGAGEDVLVAIREAKLIYERPNQTGSTDIPNLWASLGRLYAQREGRLLELDGLNKEIVAIAQRLRELN